jgi:hypothetical protein
MVLSCHYAFGLLIWCLTSLIMTLNFSNPHSLEQWVVLLVFLFALDYLMCKLANKKCEHGWNSTKKPEFSR